MSSCHPSDCRCCPLSRRRFLKCAAALTATAPALALMGGCATTKGAASAKLAPTAGAAASSGCDLAEVIDVAALRPKPSVKVMAAILRRKPPYWLGWPGTSFDLEGHEREYSEQLNASCRALGLDLQLEPQPLEAEDTVQAFVRAIGERRPHGVVVVLEAIAVWPWAQAVADAAAKAGAATIVFAPIGTAFTKHIDDLSRQPGVRVVSSLDYGAVEMALRMVRAKQRFAATRVLWIRGEERGESVMERLGVTVRKLPRRVFNELFERMPESDEARDVARAMARHAHKVVEPSRQDLLNAARVYTTAKRLMRDEDANALSMDCLGMVRARIVPTPPCMAWSILQDSGVTAGCEADLYGAASLMLTSYLFDKPGYMNDPVPETAHNTLVAAHCVCGTRLDGFDQPRAPFVLRSHSESDLGVSLQVLWPEGKPVTLVRFKSPHELILDTGVVVGNVDTPPAGGCRTSVEIKMDDVQDSRDVLGFHQVVFAGNHRRDIETFCQLYGIAVTHSADARA